VIELTNPAARKPRLITGRRIVISVLLAGCAVLLVWGLSGVRTQTGPVIYNDPAVKSLTPPPGAAAPRQSHIAVTLNQPFTLGSTNTNPMTIDGQGIPQDQVEVFAGLNQFWYTPAPGKQISALPRGRNCVSIFIHSAVNPADPGRTFAWCFNSQ
jgi:hypothetical protein